MYPMARTATPTYSSIRDTRSKPPTPVDSRANVQSNVTPSVFERVNEGSTMAATNPWQHRQPHYYTNNTDCAWRIPPQSLLSALALVSVTEHNIPGS